MLSRSDALGVAAYFFPLLLALVDGGFRGHLVVVERGGVLGLVEGKLAVFALPVGPDIGHACSEQVNIVGFAVTTSRDGSGWWGRGEEKMNTVTLP